MKKSVIMLMLASVAMWGCAIFTGCKESDEPDLPEEPGVTEEYKLPAISKDAAVSAAKDAMVKMGYLTAAEAAEPEVVPYSSSEKNDTVFYLVRFASNGFAAINADPASKVSVLAVSESDVFPEAAESYVLGAAQASGAPAGNSQLSAIAERSDTVNHVFATPLWGVDAPFNKYCVTPEGQQSSVGSVALAVGMALSCYRIPEVADNVKLNWDEMLAANPTEEGIDMIAHLLHGIGVTGGATYQEYKAKLGYGEIIKLLGAYGFSKAFKTQKFNEIKNNLAENHPVIISGITTYDEVWSWLTDGYMVTYDYYPEKEKMDGITPVITNYYHFNWGLEGDGDGYYVAGTNYTPSKAQNKMILQITAGIY